MKCVKCGSETRVIETRQHAAAVIRRRRACTNAACGHRVTTEETVLPAASLLRQKPIGEVALALAEKRRQVQLDARRANEDRALLRDLGIDEDYGDDDDGR
ncbi:ogr/Delta-like zinc finger family protein [Flavobacterium sp.]|jgi:transcriptional regulator NrdR family protein|uniref:NrdR family transcriptional regulator n=1 Tax=Flavobacterium sp. TaxID=239 RepID=UPI0037C13A35